MTVPNNRVRPAYLLLLLPIAAGAWALHFGAHRDRRPAEASAEGAGTPSPGGARSILRPAGPPQAAAMAVWPWPGAAAVKAAKGITDWQAQSADGRQWLDLIEIDFRKDPKLRLELFDQAAAGDGVDYWPTGVAQAAVRANAAGQGPVLAAWNGSYFNIAGQAPPRHGVAGHLAPVVRDGAVEHNVGRVRWVFGETLGAGGPRFAAIPAPAEAGALRRFTWAEEGGQCLIAQGRPLAIRAGKTAPLICEAGATGLVNNYDAAPISRTSMGWTKDSGRLDVLIERGRGGGWTTADLQTFWRARKVWGAVNLSGGGNTQMALRQADGSYLLAAPDWASALPRQVVPADGAGAPGGGTLTYWVVRRAQ